MGKTSRAASSKCLACIRNTPIKVKIDGQIYTIYKAISLKGSKEIDRLMDKHIEYKLEDYKVD